MLETNSTSASVEMEDVIQAFQVKDELDGKQIFESVQVNISFAKERTSIEEVPVHKYFENSEGFTSGNTYLQIPLSLEESYQHMYNNDIDRYSVYNQHSPPYEDYNDMRVSHIPRTMSLRSRNLPINEEKAMNTLLVKNLPRGITAFKLFRLFGAYGNVLKVKIFYKNPENALIEFQDYMQANLAKRNLNNCPLFGSNLFVISSKQGIVIDTRILKKDVENVFAGDFSTSTEHRYKFAGSKNHCNIAPLSRVLHLSNLCEDKEEGFYKELFSEHGNIRKFLFLKGKDKMALVEMESIAEAVKILVDFHNYDIKGKFLKVSFSKYQKVQEPK